MDHLQEIFPDHDIFQHPVDYSHLLPSYLHGDGGRTYKKDSLRVLSMFNAFGEGTSRNLAELQPVPGSQPKRSAARDCGSFQPGVNLKGNPFTNRYLFTAKKTELGKKKALLGTVILGESQAIIQEVFQMFAKVLRALQSCQGFVTCAQLAERTGHRSKISGFLQQTGLPHAVL